MEFKHASVLFNEVMDGLDPKPGGIYLDGTLGGGGHSNGICSRLGEDGLLVGVDRDPGRPWRGTLASGHKPR